MCPGGGPGQASCTEYQLAASWMRKAKDRSVPGELLFQAVGNNIYCSVCNFPYLLVKMRNKKNSSVQPIRSAIKLNLIFCSQEPPGWLQHRGWLRVETSSVLSFLPGCAIYHPSPASSPISRHSARPTTTSQGSRALSARTNTNSPLTGQQSFSEMDFVWEQPEHGEGWELGWQQGRQGCFSPTRAADPQSPNKKSRAGLVVVPRASRQPRLPRKSPAMRQVWPTKAGPRPARQGQDQDRKVQD